MTTNNLFHGTPIYVLDLATKKATAVQPENPEVLGDGFDQGREWRYIPELRIAVIGSGLCTLQKVKGKDQEVAGTDLPAYDLARNRWLVLKVQGSTGITADGSMHYDEGRKLLWVLSSRGDVRVLRLDLEKALAGGQETPGSPDVE